MFALLLVWDNNLLLVYVLSHKKTQLTFYIVLFLPGSSIQVRAAMADTDDRSVLPAEGREGEIGGAGEEEKIDESDGGGSEELMLSQLIFKQTWTEHSKTVTISLALSADGRIAVSGGGDGSIRVWDVHKGECLSVLEKAHPSFVQCVLLTGDQSNIISCGLDGSVKSWAFDGLQLKLVWEKEVVFSLRCLCLNDDETIIAGASKSDKHCFVLSRADGTMIGKIAGSNGLFAMCFARSWLLCGGDNKTVEVIDVSKKSVVRQLTGATGVVSSIAYCPSLDLVAAGTHSSIPMWHLSTGESVTRLTGHTSAVTSLLFHPINPNILISCSGDESIRMWNVSDSVCVCCVKVHTDWIYSLSVSPDGKVLLSVSRDNIIKKWSIEYF